MTYIKKNLHFFNLKKNALRTDQPTDGPTDGRTDSTCNPTDHVPVFRASRQFTVSLYRILFFDPSSESRVKKIPFFPPNIFQRARPERALNLGIDVYMFEVSKIDDLFLRSIRDYEPANIYTKV